MKFRVFLVVAVVIAAVAMVGVLGPVWQADRRAAAARQALVLGNSSLARSEAETAIGWQTDNPEARRVLA